MMRAVSFLFLVLLISVVSNSTPTFASTQADGGVAADPQVPQQAQIQIAPLDRQKLQQDLNNLYSVIENQYGPLSIKSKTIGLNWAQLKAEYTLRVGDIKSVKEFYFLIAEFLGRLNDAHVSIVLPTTLKYLLPMQFSYVDGKTVLNYVNLNYYPKDEPQAQIGDELVSVNGQPLADLQKQLSVFNKFGNTLTNHAMFARQLSSMSEASGIPLSYMDPKVVFTFRSHDTGKDFDVHLAYLRGGIGMFDRPVGDPGMTIDPSSLAATPQDVPAVKELRTLLESPFLSGMSDDSKDKILRTLRFAYQYQDLMNTQTDLADIGRNEAFAAAADPTKPDPNIKGMHIDMGHRLPTFQLPKDFKEITPPAAVAKLLNSDSFFAGTFKHNGKTIGLLRIPSYMADTVATLSFSLRYYIGKLQAESDALIIDQMDNPGGMVLFSDMFIKSLTGDFDPSKHLRFAVKPSQNFMRSFTSLIEAVNTQLGPVLTDDQRKSVTMFLIGELKKIQVAYLSGADLSEPISMLATPQLLETLFDTQFAKIKTIGSFLARHLMGVDIFAKQAYTKPIYFLTNEMDFSGGDATPASFQDYGRGKIVGVRTAGAGGTVEEFSDRNTVEYTYRLTTSLMIRKDGGLVENLGVHPDVDFVATPEDYRDGFKNYLGRLLQTLSL